MSAGCSDTVIEHNLEVIKTAPGLATRDAAAAGNGKPTKASDHNMYVKGDRIYQSNYKAGLRILDISDPKNPKEVGFLDTQPGENSPGFSGSWNNYPFFKNGAIGVVSIGEGFFMVRDGTRKIVP